MAALILKYRKYKRQILNYFTSAPGNFGQRLTQWITVIGTIIAIIYAIMTYSLSVEVGKDKAQLNELKTIVKNQSNEISILLGLVQQSAEQSKELKSQGIEITQQTKDINQNLSLNRQQNQRMIQNSLVDKKSNFNKLKRTVTDMNQLTQTYNIWRDSTLTIDQKTNFLTDIKPLFESELSNPYLLSQDSLAYYWTTMYSFTLMTINSLQPLVGQVEVNGKILNEDELQTWKNSEFKELFFENYSKFTHYILRKTNLF